MSEEMQGSNNPKKKISLILILAILAPTMFSLLHFGLDASWIRSVVITVFVSGFVVYFRLHLSHEKPLVLCIMGTALIFLIFMIFLFWVGYWSLPQGSQYVP